MASSLDFVAVDLGADSGRLMLGRFDGDRLSLEQVHRFDSHPVRLPGGLFTDVAHIWQEIRVGLRAAASACAGRIDGIGVDTWGVDFALFDAEDGLLGLPYHYRSDFSDGALEKAAALMPRPAIFAATGVQILPFNTLYQLLALADKRPSFLRAARRLLFMPDLFTHWLGGDPRVDRTIASTSQCYDPAARNWSFALLDRLGLPRHVFPGIRDPGSVAGALRRDVAADAGLGLAAVLAPGGHDTALAVAAVPAPGPHFAYISSGTWSLVGTEVPSPILGEFALSAGFTNEVGVCDTIRFLKNVCGLWLEQESRRAWA
jgi:rhamnulokinase